MNQKIENRIKTKLNGTIELALEARKLPSGVAYNIPSIRS